MSDYADGVSDWTCVHCSHPCRRDHDWREAGDGRVSHNACADRARQERAHNTKETTMSTNTAIDALTAQLEALVHQTAEIQQELETYLDDQARRQGKRLVRVGHAGPDDTLYALPVPYHTEQEMGESESVLRSQLREAEDWLASADSWVETTRAEERIESLRRALRYSSFDRPGADATVVAVEKEPVAEQKFAEPVVPYTDRQDVQERIDRFERRTRS